MNYKLYGVIGILALVFVVITSIIYFNDNSNVISIGGVFHLSGPGAFWGEGERNGAKLAMDEINSKGGINGRPLKFIVEDSETDFTKTVISIQKLKNVDNISIIIGPTWFGQVVGQIPTELNILMISPSAGVVPQPNKYFFDVYPTEKQETQKLVKYLFDINVKNVAIVYSLNDWSQSITDNFKQFAKDKNISIIKEFGTFPDQQDFKTIVASIKDLNVESIFVPFAFYSSQGAFSKQLKEMDLNILVFSSSGTENPILLDTYPEIDGTIYVYPEKGPQEQKFIEKYFKIYGVYPSPSASYAYDSVYLVALALRSGKESPEGISKFLFAIKNYNGVSNNISFDNNGRVINKEHIIKKVVNGKFVILE